MSICSEKQKNLFRGRKHRLFLKVLSAVMVLVVSMFPMLASGEYFYDSPQSGLNGGRMGQ